MRAGGKEKLVGSPVVCVASAELNRPGLVDDNILAVRVLDRAHKLAGFEIESIDGAVINVVRDQKGVAELAKVRRRHGEAPGLIQGLALRQLPYESSVLPKDVDVATWSPGGTGKRNIDQSADVLNAEGSEPRRQRAIGK